MQSPDVAAIVAAFDLPGQIAEAKPVTDGHINETVSVMLQGTPQVRYILQRINNTVFPHPDQLMDNYVRVTRFIRKKLQDLGEDAERGTIHLVRTRAGRKPYHLDDQGKYWRLFPAAPHTVTLMRPEKPAQMYEAGRGFGRFQWLLSDFPARELYEVIPGFHDTAMRVAAFEKAVAEDPEGRAAGVATEIAFVRAHAADASRILNLLESGELPTRVTHNDTKINNVLLDATTYEAVCVIDLDTVMPGSLLYDFGDAIRSGTNTADEDEADLSKVHLDLALYEAYARGFLQEMQDITPLEKELLPFSARLLTYECGTRFLTDYLLGDAYFRISRPTQNLDRARTQFRLVAEMIEREAEIRRMLECTERKDPMLSHQST